MSHTRETVYDSDSDSGSSGSDYSDSPSNKKRVIVIVLIICCLMSTSIFIALGYLVAPGNPCETSPRYGEIYFSMKKAQQSSTLHDSKFNVNFPQDGNLSSCSHTDYYSESNRDSTPWWRIDLVQQYVVNGVKLHGRTDCCWESNHDYQLRVGNHEESGKGIVFSLNGLCAEFPGVNYQPGRVFNFRCLPMLIGRYISIQKVVNCTLPVCAKDVLSICKLDFDGFLLEN